MQEHVELKPCPFCGRTDLLSAEPRDNGFLSIRCWACGCVAPSKLSENETEAVAHWNNRADPYLAPQDDLQKLAEKTGLSVCCYLGLAQQTKHINDIILTALQSVRQAEREKAGKLVEALKNVMMDAENCDWECQSCGCGYCMTETDLYITAKEALAEYEAALKGV